MHPNQQQPAAPTGEIATIVNGRDITRGIVDGIDYLSPQDNVLRLRGDYNYELYKDLLRDSQVRSTFEQRRLAVVVRKWEVLPGDSSRKARKAAESIERMLQYVNWPRVTNLMLYGVFYGYAVAECIYVRDGVEVALDGIRVRNRRRFVFGADFAPRLLTSMQPKGEVLPARKFWVYSSGEDHDDEPYGLGLANSIYWPVWFKRNQVKFWLYFLERFGRPGAKGTYRQNASDNEKRELKQAVQDVMSGHGITVSDGDAIEYMESGIRGSVEYGSFYDRMNQEISKTIVGQTMTTDDGSSRSQAEVHLAVRGDIVTADAGLIVQSFNAGPVKWLTEWNYPGVAYPKVLFNLEENPDLGKLATRDATVARMMGQKPTEEYITETYGLPLQPPIPERTTTEPPDAGTSTSDMADISEAMLADMADQDPNSINVLVGQTRADIGPK